MYIIIRQIQQQKWDRFHFVFLRASVVWSFETLTLRTTYVKILDVIELKRRALLSGKHWTPLYQFPLTAWQITIIYQGATVWATTAWNLEGRATTCVDSNAALWSKAHRSAVLYCLISLLNEEKHILLLFLLFSHTSVESACDLESIRCQWLWDSELFLSDIGVFHFYFHFFPPPSTTVPFPQKCYRKLYIFPGGLARLTQANAYQRQKNDPSVCRENLLTLYETNLISP